MPGLNMTGPGGQGPRTGRGMGRCNPRTDKQLVEPEAGNLQAGRGQGLGLGMQRGMGRGRGIGRGRNS